ncbi:MAG: LD-carboxypeptidase [Lachnospiraceae bacterium]|nr:LD-carboxypeptidase [Lachnospiraceae bacterium]
MIFPKYIQKNDTIGVTAVSDGVENELDVKRFGNAKKTLEQKGYHVLFTDDVFKVADKGKSADGKTRAVEWNALVDDDRVTAIISAKGGNFLNEMLEYVDFEKMTATPKWFQGYSDNTCLVHTLTTKYDIASIYGSNFGEFGMEKWHTSVENNYRILCGDLVEQKSFDKYQAGFSDRVTGLEGYLKDSDVIWKPDQQTQKKTDVVTISGRLIGGCLDVLFFLQGTKYDGTERFINKYKEDGIIWYLESCETTAEIMMMFLWKLKEVGWFRYTKGVMMGRPLFYRDSLDTSYEEAVMYALGSLDIPVIFDCDFGHLGPRMTMINGAIASVRVENGKGILNYHL